MDYALQDPRLTKVTTATQQLLTEVTTAVDSLNKIRPLSPDLAARLREALLPDRVVASLNMEGIVATRRQTLAVMDAMRVQESIGAGTNAELPRNDCVASESEYARQQRHAAYRRQRFEQIHLLMWLSGGRR